MGLTGRFGVVLNRGMTTNLLPANWIAASRAKLAGPLGYIHGWLITVPGSIYFMGEDNVARFVPVNRPGVFAVLDDNGDVLVQVGPEAKEIVRAAGGSTELQRLGVFTYRKGERLDFLGEEA
jgi:hypothetical protein